MTIAQTVYSKFFAGAVAGALFDISEFLDIIIGTDIASADSGGVPFGFGLCQDTGSSLPHRFTNQPETDKLVKLPAVVGDAAFPTFLGVALKTSLVENDAAFVSASLAKVWPQNHPISILHKGRIWVEPEDTPGVGDDVYVRFGSGGGGTAPGAFRTDADTATAGKVTSARWYRGVDAAGLAVLEMNA